MTSPCHDAGVEHLLRDVKDASVGTLATEVGHMNAGLQGLLSRLRQVVIMLTLVPYSAAALHR
jgi:26S proteasome regulatory subunit N8